MHRDCFCDASCILFGDCCFDHQTVCKEHYPDSTDALTTSTSYVFSTNELSCDNYESECLTEDLLQNHCPMIEPSECPEEHGNCAKYSHIDPKTCSECAAIGDKCIVELGHTKKCTKLQKKCKDDNCPINTVENCSDCEDIGFNCLKKLKLTKQCKKFGWNKKKGCF